MKTIIIISSCDGCGYTSTVIYFTDKYIVEDVDNDIKLCEWKFCQTHKDEAIYLSRGSVTVVQAETFKSTLNGFYSVDNFREEYALAMVERERQERQEYLELKAKYEELKDKFD
jgi:hypothetical protein